MSDTTNLALPLLEAAQAQKHVTHNEALALLDGLVQLAVKSRVLATPPTTPAEGDRYLVAAAPTGLWSGQAGKLAQNLAGLWVFRVPREGWRLWVDDENVLLVFDGAAWAAVGVPSELQNLTKIGVNTTADATNKLAVSSSAVLFNHAGTGSQLKVNKNTAADSASVLFQTGFTGRAEFGATGDDDFHMKVSADGTTFNEAIVLAAASGRTTIKKTLLLEPQAADPATPGDGQLWYNSTSGKFRARQNGATVDVVGGSGGAAAWGGITGTLSAQTDLQTALNAKAATAHTHVLADVTNVTITAANLNALDDGVDTALHFHASDRNRANHTGTQTSATISDFNTATDARADARIIAASINALGDVVITTPTTGQVIKFNGTNWINDTDATSAGGGSGDVVGPASSTDKAMARFSLATGKLIQNSVVLVSDVGEITQPVAAVPADPGSGRLVRSAMTRGGFAVPIYRAASDITRVMQKDIGQTAIAHWQSPGNGITVPGVTGINAWTVVGTATARNVATTNKATRQRRLGFVSAATAAALAGQYSGAAQFTIGDGAGIGGFHYLCRFVPSDAAAVAGARMFVGLRNAIAAPTNVEPSSGQTNMIGVAQISTSNNLQIVFGGSTAQTAIDLGVNFPANGLSTDVYELVIYSPPNAANTVFYRVTRVNTGAIAEAQLGPGTAGVTLPAATTFLGHAAWRCNNATALAVGLDICTVYMEQLDTA